MRRARRRDEQGREREIRQFHFKSLLPPIVHRRVMMRKSSPGTCVNSSSSTSTAHSCSPARAGLRAMNRACEELVGHPDALAGIPVAGRTDRIILVRRGRRAPDRTLDDALLARAAREVRRASARGDRAARARGVEGVMPGIRPLLDALERRDDVFLGLLTGNFERARGSSSNTSTCGATSGAARLATTAADRNALVPFALDRARDAAACLTSRRRTSSWSATRRTTSPARAPSAPCRWRRDRRVQRRSAARPAARRSCSRI